MAYITREDGEHFVIPSYRDVLSAKPTSVLKKDVILLSQSYGTYITMQKKGAAQYEVAFSPDTGYLLGESVWHFFKRPLDMIYCEAIPNTTEAILVIVKAGSVYLDGSFPLESIPEELVIFLTQQNNFEIYIYGDVPISQTPEAGKFSFEANSVKSFTVLDSPVFATLPLLKIYQLQPVDVVLKAQGIGVFPIRSLLILAVIIGAVWMGYNYLSTKKVSVVPVKQVPNPYEGYNTALMSPEPEQIISQFLDKLQLLLTMPGWRADNFTYDSGKLTASVTTLGGRVEDLSNWVSAQNLTLDIKPNGLFIVMNLNLPNRPLPRNIYSIKQLVATLVDRIASVYPGNNLVLTDFGNKGSYVDLTFTINIDNLSPLVLSLIGSQFKDLRIADRIFNLTSATSASV